MNRLSTSAVVDASNNLWRAQVKLLGAVCPIGRWGMELVRRAGIGAEHFRDDDCRAIWAALELADADGRIIDRLPTVKLCRAALRIVGHWRDDDQRNTISGSTWAPGSLATLFTRLDQHEAEESLPVAAAELIAAVAEWDRLSIRGEGVAA